MCGTCGCADPKNAVTMTDVASGEKTLLREGLLVGEPAGHTHHHAPDHSHPHDHEHGHAHSHDHSHAGDDVPHHHGPNGEVILLETAVLAKNDQIAARNRGWFEGRGVLALNLVSSPGAGKTTLLEKTIRESAAADLSISVIEGDQMTANDAERIREAGARAIQVNTGAGCHLEADMIASAIETLQPDTGSVLMIENVGNLVCPAMFDLGERMKVAVISTTEGEDKPIKYPHMFSAAEVVLINKIDLAPHVDFDERACRGNIQAVNPTAKILSVSAKTGEGMSEWLGFLQSELASLS